MGGNAATPLEPVDEAIDLVVPTVALDIVDPLSAVGLARDHGLVAQLDGQAAGAVRPQRRGPSGAPGGLKPGRARAAGRDRLVRRPPDQMSARAPAGCPRRPRPRATCRSGHRASVESPRAAILGCAGTVRVELDERAFQGERVQVHRGQRLVLRFDRHTLQCARLGPAVEADIDRVPVAELARQAAPGTALKEHAEPGVAHLPVRDLEMVARRRQQRGQPRVMRVPQLRRVAHLVTSAAPPTVPTLSQLRRDVNMPSGPSPHSGRDPTNHRAFVSLGRLLQFG